MKVPDLASHENAGMRRWSGPVDPLRPAAAEAQLTYCAVDLSHIKDRAGLFAALDRSLRLPEHFGSNFDALADCLEDRDWLGKQGRVVAFLHVAAYRKEHAGDWLMIEDIFSEASSYWQERHVAFWVFVA